MAFDTKYAPAIKDNVNQIISDFEKLKALPLIESVFDTLPYYVCIINDKRQLVYSNDSLLSRYNLTLEDILGKRQGEIFNCINADKEFGGCGTSEYCKLCGGVNIILLCQSKRTKVSEECRILAKKDNKITAYDFLITASPFNFEDRLFTIVSLEDISEIKRKRLLERMFFHDILNTVGSLNGLVQYLNSNPPPAEFAEIKKDLSILSNRLIEEILTQRDLTAAENGELNISLLRLNNKLVIENIVSQISYSEIAKDKKIIISSDLQDSDFETDKNLLYRILTNMLKNALEASEEGNTVTIGSKLIDDNKILFWVHNHSIIPKSTQFQIFQRNFSTKGKSRGLGTFSMKIFAENYLHGKVDFVSDIKTGTTFSLTLPIINNDI